MNKFIKLHSVNTETKEPLPVIVSVEEIQFVEFNSYEGSTSITLHEVSDIAILYVTETVDEVYELLLTKGC
jgi:hypothetical protein